VFAAFVLASGCGAFEPSTGPASPNSFTAVYEKVIRPTCSSDFCHYNGVGIRYSALDMSSQVFAYWSLVGQPCMGPSCSEMGMRVVPGRPEASILYLKVSETMPPCGSQMPADPVALTAMGTSVFSGTALPDDELALIKAWILEGAHDN
jgi:hypothetical protein